MLHSVKHTPRIYAKFIVCEFRDSAQSKSVTCLFRWIMFGKLFTYRLFQQTSGSGLAVA
jgi:hypothetical protein